MTRERSAIALDGDDPGIPIDFEATEMERASQGLIRGLRSPQHGAKASEKLARTERFWEIVVCTDFETHDSIGFVSARREHQDRDIRMLTDSLADFESVEVRQHDIENDSIEGLFFERRESGVGSETRDDLEISRLEKLGEHLGQRFVVIDDQSPHSQIFASVRGSSNLLITRKA